MTELHPLRESLWCLLWQALAHEGRRAEITVSHRRSVEILAERYALPPSSALDDAARALSG